MKNKLKLAITSIILSFVLHFFLGQYYYIFRSGDGFSTGLREVLYIVAQICSLGTLPFFMGLYKNKKLLGLLAHDEQENVIIADELWVKHALIRLGIILLVVGIFFLIGMGGGLGGAMLTAYGIAYWLGISAFLLSVEAVVMLVKKRYCKMSVDLFFVLIELVILYKMM